MSINLVKTKKNCCGCTACQNICPVDAIQMEADDEGFLYPKIDNSLCVECGKCLKVCMFSKNEFSKNETNIIKGYGVKLNSIEDRLNSQSGGAFSAISNYFLNKDSSVYATIMSEKNEAIYTNSNSVQVRDEMRGSKYVQSKLGNTFERVMDDLVSGKKCLFVGTPCYVEGLKSFLFNSKISFENLTTIDFICHGVPSPMVLKDYLNYLENKNGKKIVKFNFRDKRLKVWKQSNHTESILFDDGTKKKSETYATLFHSEYLLRPSCYNCKHSCRNRTSDITIADFWYLDKFNKKFSDLSGVSLVFLNNKEKDEFLTNALEKNTSFFEFNSNEYKQHNLERPSREPIDRDDFWYEYRNKNLELIYRKYSDFSIKYRLQRSLKRIIKKILKR